jgi:hypothetical protein
MPVPPVSAAVAAAAAVMVLPQQFVVHTFLLATFRARLSLPTFSSSMIRFS